MAGMFMCCGREATADRDLFYATVWIRLFADANGLSPPRWLLDRGGAPSTALTA